MYHPLLKKNIDFGKEETYAWTLDFFNALKSKRKVALRMGKLSNVHPHYILSPEKVKKLCAGTIAVTDLTEQRMGITDHDPQRQRDTQYALKQEDRN